MYGCETIMGTWNMRAVGKHKRSGHGKGSGHVSGAGVAVLCNAPTEEFVELQALKLLHAQPKAFPHVSKQALRQLMGCRNQASLAVAAWHKLTGVAAAPCSMREHQSCAPYQTQNRRM